MKVMKHMHGMWETGRRGVWFPAVLAAVFFFAVVSESAGSSSSIQGNDLFFAVETEFGGFSIGVSPGIERITYLSLRLEGYRCGGITITGDIHAESRDIWPIVHNRFEIDTNLGIYQVVICGVVDEARREICGSWRIHSAGTVCSGEWKSDLQK